MGTLVCLAISVDFFHGDCLASTHGSSGLPLCCDAHTDCDAIIFHAYDISCVYLAQSLVPHHHVSAVFLVMMSVALSTGISRGITVHGYILSRQPLVLVHPYRLYYVV